MSISLLNINFKSPQHIYSQAKRILKSYDAAGIIDEGEFPTYVKEVLDSLGIAVYKEQQAILNIRNGKACLPPNFEVIYNAYKCELDMFTVRDKQLTEHVQSNSFSFERDVTQDFLLNTRDCDISCMNSGTEVIESINIKTKVYTGADLTYTRIIPLKPSIHIDRDLLLQSDIYIPYEDNYSYSIKDNVFYAPFDTGIVYLTYYGLPIDEDGELEIPDIYQVEQAVKWYIIYQFLLSCWFDSSVPDIQNKWQKAEIEYKDAFGAAKNYLKTPGFSTLVNTIRRNRRTNKLAFFSSNYLGTNYQRTY